MKNAFDLSQRRILVTGAAQGIGAATAKVCASLGAELVLVDMQSAENVADQIREMGGKAEAIVADVGTRSRIELQILWQLPARMVRPDRVRDNI